MVASVTVRPERAGRGRRFLATALLGVVSLILFEAAVVHAAGTRRAVASPEPPPAAAPARRPARPPVPQAILAPLAAEAIASPGHGPLFSPDLAEVAVAAPPRAPAPAAPKPAAVPPPAPDGPASPEPPPAVAEPAWTLPIPDAIPLGLTIDGTCVRAEIGPFNLSLGCDRPG
ncbi:MAG: hypothetical protein ABIY58_12910 [Acidimicrobiales bacterium]